MITANLFRPGQLVERAGVLYRVIGVPRVGSVIESSGEPYYVYFKHGEAPSIRVNQLLEKSAFEDGRFTPAGESAKERRRETF